MSATGRRLGPISIIAIVILSVLFGALGGAVVAKQMESSRSGNLTGTGTSRGGPGIVVSHNDNVHPLAWAEVARLDGPAVVTIVNTQKPQRDLFGNVVPGGTGEGSGFIIDRKGDIVTNNHVIEGAQSLQVVFADGHKASSTVVHADPLSDLAVIRVATRVTSVLRFGNSTALQPGEPVLAIGSALGEYRNTVTSGVLSASGRTINEPNGVALHDMLQTDAAINQGNSGGPLLNDRGEVIGVNTAITRGAQQTDIFGGGSSVVAVGLGFAIPSSTVRNVVARLVQNKPPAFLGVQYHQISQQDSVYYSLPQGAYVNSVRPGSPAAEAGLRPRDIITDIGGQPVNDTYSLEEIVAQHSPGQLVKIKAWRTGKPLGFTVRLEAKPSS